VIAAGAWIVAIGYLVVAHAVDPCVNGFHLLAQAAPAAALPVLYLWAIRRWAPHPFRDLRVGDGHV